VQELKRLVPDCINQKAKTLSYAKKLAEGGFNRVFQISMRDSSKLVARIPYPSTAPSALQ